MMTGKRILLIEDNITLATGLGACLVASNYQLQHVGNGAEALSVCQQQLPDLVITDMLMQPMDGLTFLQHFRALPGGWQVPVMVISGIAQPGAFEELKKLGVRQFLVKPFSLEHFLNIVCQTISGTAG